MNGRVETTLLLLIAVLVTAAASAGAQSPTTPPRSGNHITARDGDVIVVENDAKVGIVRRREAFARVAFNAEERWLVLLVDDVTPERPADGRVDSSHYFKEVAGPWPFGARWEGRVTIDEYLVVGQGGPVFSGGVGVATSEGLVQLFPRQSEFHDPNAVAVLSYRGGGRSGASNGDFDEAERREVAQVRSDGGVTRLPDGGTAYTSLSLQAGIGAGDPGGAVRVGGNVRPPMKIVDVRPVVPEQARAQGIRGTVILEITIEVDGTVKDARVLRGIPMLDAAALEAVRKWRYEATTIGDRSIPVVMTVSVQF